MRALLLAICLPLPISAAAAQTSVDSTVPAVDSAAARTVTTDSLISSPPHWVDEAIALGSAGQARPITFSRSVLGIPAATFGTATTPFLRVALAAKDARDKLMPFGREQVTSEMLAPVIRVELRPLFGKKINDVHRGVEHVVVRPRGSKDLAEVTQPLTITKLPLSAQNSFGADVVRDGVVATFPLSALQEGNEFFVRYERAAMYESDFAFKIDKKMLASSLR